MTGPAASCGRGTACRTGTGCCCAREAADRLRLERLVASALPAPGAVAVSGSMLLGRGSGSPPLVVHVKPVAVPQADYGARHTAALILIVEPGRGHRIDPDLVAGILGLTPMESPGGGLVGRRQERPRHGRGHGAHRRLHLLAPEADLPETAGLPAGGSGAAGAVDHRVRITAAVPTFPEGGGVTGRSLFSPNLPILVGTGRRDRAGWTPGLYRPPLLPESTNLAGTGRRDCARNIPGLYRQHPTVGADSGSPVRA